MPSTEDQRLLELAAEPAGELFPMLRRAAAFRPLLVLLAVLPGLYALTNRTFTDTAAWWALASVELATRGAEPLEESPGSEQTGMIDDAVAAPWRPPLAVWLTAGAMRVFGTDQSIAVVLVSYLATITLVVLVYHVLGRLGDARLGLWAAGLIALHGPLLAQAQTPVPVSLGCVLALGAAWGFFSHLPSAAPVSTALLLGGLSLGVCLLAAGPLVPALVVILAVAAFVIPSRRPAARVISHPAVARRRTSWPPILPLGVLLLTAFAVGGWWPLMTWWEVGAPELESWLALGRATADVPGSETGAESVRFWLRMYDEWHEAIGALAGLVLLGLWRAVRVGFAPGAEGRAGGDGVSPAWLRFLVIWAAVSLPAWCLVLAMVGTSPQAVALWRGFAVVPIVGLAAFAADEIARRRIGVFWALAASLASVALAVESEWWRRLFAPPAEPAVLMAVLLAAGPLAVALIWRITRHRDERQQAVLALLLVGHLAGNAALGLSGVHRQTDDDRALATFRRELSQAVTQDKARPIVATWKLISDVEPPLTLRYVLRSQWPAAQTGEVETWDAALAGALEEKPSPQRWYVVVEWSVRETQPANIPVPGLKVVPVGRPQFYRGRQLRAFIVTSAAA